MITQRINRSLRTLLPAFLACVSSTVCASTENATAPMNYNIAAGESQSNNSRQVEIGHVIGPIEDIESFDDSQDHLTLLKNVDAFLNGKLDKLFGFDSRVTPR